MALRRRCIPRRNRSIFGDVTRQIMSWLAGDRRISRNGAMDVVDFGLLPNRREWPGNQRSAGQSDELPSYPSILDGGAKNARSPAAGIMGNRQIADFLGRRSTRAGARAASTEIFFQAAIAPRSNIG